MGNSFVINQASELEKISFRMGNSLCDGMSSACSLDNLDITADIYSSDPMTGVPIDIIASTVAFTVPVDPNAQHVLELPIVGGPFH